MHVIRILVNIGKRNDDSGLHRFSFPLCVLTSALFPYQSPSFWILIKSHVILSLLFVIVVLSFVFVAFDQPPSCHGLPTQPPATFCN